MNDVAQDAMGGNHAEGDRGPLCRLCERRTRSLEADLDRGRGTCSVTKGRGTMAECKARRSDRSACHTPAMDGADVCFWHNPDSLGARQEASRRSGGTTGAKSSP